MLLQELSVSLISSLFLICVRRLQTEHALIVFLTWEVVLVFKWFKLREHGLLVD